MEDTSMNLGSLIEEYVRKQNMSIKDFATKINVSRQYANRLFKNSNFSIQLVRTISLALDHNFFVDLANNPKLADIKKEAMTIKMKDLSEWLKYNIYSTIHEMYSNNPNAKEFNEWVKKFSLLDAEFYVWENSLLELKTNGLEDEDEVTINEASQFVNNSIENILSNWYINELIDDSWLILDDSQIALMEVEMQKIPVILKQEAIHNLSMELYSKDKDELRGQTIKIPVWVCPQCFGELVGVATINFDSDCNIIGFNFDTRESTL